MTEEVVAIDSQKEEVVAVEESNSQTNLTQLEQDIIKQIEYYFGESNLRRDKFLIGKIAENEEGWVPISVLLTFNRLKALSDDAKVIAESVEKSSSGLVQVSEDKEKFRRHPENPLPEFNEARRKELQERTAYAKGFPLDSNMDTLLKYFNNNFENVENVIMRKYYCPKGKVYLFKGSVYALFANKENAEDFVKRPELKYEEKTLLRYMQAEYMEIKKAEKAKKDKKGKKKEEEVPDIVLPKNAIVHFSGVDGEISREDIRKKVAEIDPALVVAFVHFARGDKQGELRFTKDDDGKKFLEKVENGKMKLNELELDMSLVEGEQEEAFLKTALEDMRKARQRSTQKHNGGKGRRGGGGGGGGYRNDRKRKNEEGEDAPAKHVKTDNEPVVAAAE